MSTLNSNIILCHNIKMDKKYSNVLSYSESAMLELCQNNAVASASDYSFIRENGAILMEVPYGTALQCNYMAYQNKDYSGKWFFAFIDKVEYVSNKSTRILFTVDSWSTWYSYWNLNSIFINREHVSDDTIGLHTIPEDLNYGEFVNVKNPISTTIGNHMYICVVSSKNIGDGQTSLSSKGTLINGIYNGLNYAFFEDIEVDDNTYAGWYLANKYISYFETTAGLSVDDVIAVFMCPKNIVGGDTTTHYFWKSGDTGLYFKELRPTTAPVTMERYLLLDDYTLAGGYVPKNKKLLCSPYRYLLATNNTGESVMYQYEYFAVDLNQSGENVLKFYTYGAISQGCSMKCVPRDYKNVTGDNFIESINYSKYPIGAWVGDSYTNWLTQNAINLQVEDIKGTLKTGFGIAQMAHGGPGGLENTLSGLADIAGAEMDKYEHSFMPSQANGNLNVGDVVFGCTKNDITFYFMSIKPEYARVLDQFFNKFGYTVNTVKTPNITGRTYWNYVKVGADEKTVYGSIPQNYIDEINNAFIRGVTIWHNHSNIGNFGLDNSL